MIEHSILINQQNQEYLQKRRNRLGLFQSLDLDKDTIAIVDSTQ